MRIVFMGTPGFAAEVLRGLIESRHAVVGVVTRPDRPRGRGKHQAQSEVSSLAAEHGLPVVKPASRKDPGLIQSLQAWAPDVAVVAAFGMILNPDVLAVPARGCINVHASLLPKFRGAAPIQDAIIRGEAVTGVTTMLMDEGIDTGDMLLQASIPIGEELTAGELEEALAVAGRILLLETLDRLEDDNLTRTPQDGVLATYSPSLRPDAGYVHWNQTAAQIHNQIRGCTPRPGARCFAGGSPVKIWRALPCPESQPGAPGEVVDVDKTSLAVACAEGAVRLLEVQPAGRGRMSGGDYARGLRLKAGSGFRFDSISPMPDA